MTTLILIAGFVITVVLLVRSELHLRSVEAALIAEKTQHEVCHQRTFDIIRQATGRSEPEALEAAADAWDSIEEKANIERLSRAYSGTVSVPAMWLRDRAHQHRKQTMEMSE